jgi:Ca2+-binding RTX toxin-like protein
LGNGNNFVLGGMGADQITTGSGTDTIFGDNGYVQMDVEGNNFASFGTKSQPSTSGPITVTDLGGDDVILSQAGDKRLIGGDAADRITATDGNHIVFGDNGLVTYVAIAQAGAGSALRYETTDLLPVTAGIDVLVLGNGNNTVFGGMGGDQITTGSGADTVFGDNGYVQMDAAGNVFVQILSTLNDLGGDDVVKTQSGTKRVVGGFGADRVTAGAGDHMVAGDNLQVDYDTTTYSGAAVRYETTDMVDTTGAADIITLGDGDNMVFGGAGGDVITTGSGVDVITGDNAVIELNVIGTLYVSITTTDFDVPVGGNDTIMAGEGNKVVFGGYGNDTMTTAGGDDIIFGDNGQIVFTSGVMTVLHTTDDVPATAGHDDIKAGDGLNIVFGGFGNDTVKTGDGSDIVIGDQGVIANDENGVIIGLITLNPSVGGFDTLTLGGGDDIGIGGAGNDSISGEAGNDIMFGDGAGVAYEAGVIYQVSAVDVAWGSGDVITGGDGRDILVGGLGVDSLDGNLTDDLVFGGVASITIVNGIATRIDSDLQDAGASALFDGFNSKPGSDDEDAEEGNVAVIGGNDEDTDEDAVSLSALTMASVFPEAAYGPVVSVPVIKLSEFGSIFKLGTGRIFAASNSTSEASQQQNQQQQGQQQQGQQQGQPQQQQQGQQPEQQGQQPQGQQPQGQQPQQGPQQQDQQQPPQQQQQAPADGQLLPDAAIEVPAASILDGAEIIIGRPLLDDQTDVSAAGESGEPQADAPAAAGIAGAGAIGLISGAVQASALKFDVGTGRFVRSTAVQSGAARPTVSIDNASSMMERQKTSMLRAALKRVSSLWFGQSSASATPVTEKVMHESVRHTEKQQKQKRRIDW